MRKKNTNRILGTEVTFAATGDTLCTNTYNMYWLSAHFPYFLVTSDPSDKWQTDVFFISYVYRWKSRKADLVPMSHEVTGKRTCTSPPPRQTGTDPLVRWQTGKISFSWSWLSIFHTCANESYSFGGATNTCSPTVFPFGTTRSMADWYYTYLAPINSQISHISALCQWVIFLCWWLWLPYN